MNTKLPWREYTYVAFDTETTGAYPLGTEVCELAAVKWRGGEIVDTFSTLIKPKQRIGEFVIKIHGITNEMVAHSPAMSGVVLDFYKFIQGAICVAHHAPFDLGFMAHEFEKAKFDLPKEPALCTSLLARRLFPGSRDHKLQTLIEFFGIEKGQAHRALDDAKACLSVALKCFEKVGDGNASLEEVYKVMNANMMWPRYGLKEVHDTDCGSPIINAILDQNGVEIVYMGGSKPGKARVIYPIGFVRNPDGDFVVARSEVDGKDKRFTYNKITSAKRLG